MSDKNEYIDNLLATVSNSIEEIQIKFDDYQNAFFSERTPQFFCLELNGEAGELANDEKKIWKGREISHEKLADEAADVLIALFNYANSRKINLGASLKHKLRKIEQIRLERAKEGKEY